MHSGSDSKGKDSLTPRSKTLLSTYLGPRRGQVLLLASLLFSGIGLQLINPQVIRFFLDTAQSGGGQRALLLAAGLYIGLSAAQRVLALGANTLATNLGWSATNALRSDLMRHCLRLDMPFHKQHTPGELIERIDGDVYVLANYFSRFMLQILGNSLLVAGILAMLLREDLRVGLGLTVYCLAVFLLLNRLRRLAVARWSAAWQAGAEQYGYIEERISGAEEIRAQGAQPYVLFRLYQLMRVYMEKYRAAFLMDNLMINLTRLLFAGSYALGLGLGVYLYTRGAASLGTAYLIVFYIGMISEPLIDLQRQLQDFQQATASIQRIQELFGLEPAVRDPQPALSSTIIESGEKPGRVDAEKRISFSPVVTRLPEGPLGVEFQQVSFHYEDNHVNGNGRTLEDVSFQLRPGEILGVLGRTGSGKTTLTRLLFRLYDPVSGSIRLAGQDIRSLPLTKLRSRVGLVTQDVQLFGASIRDNLAMFDREIRDEDLKLALRELRLQDWLARLPAGLDTRLTPGGYGLSAGEAQLLAFTRVFLKDPGLVILDEASSRLDPLSEALLEGAVDRLLANRTGIIIAHRLRTVQRADALLILEAGRVAEYGSRLALTADPDSRFSSLLRAGLEEWLQPANESAGRRSRTTRKDE